MDFKEYWGKTYPDYEYPQHLAPIIRSFDKNQFYDLEVVISVPPQSGKTSLILALLSFIASNVSKRESFIFATYNAFKAKIECDNFQKILDLHRVRYEVTDGCLVTMSSSGASVLFASVDGAATGLPASAMLIIDDPIKNREEADSNVTRKKIWEWYSSVAFTRVHYEAAKILVMTRWHTDDLAARLINKGWRYINIKAIEGVPDNTEPHEWVNVANQKGKSYWPTRKPLKFLLKAREQVSAQDWLSLYEGNPHDKERDLFIKVDNRIHAIPQSITHVGWGLDFAYSQARYADFCAICQIGFDGVRYYIIRGELVKTPLDKFIDKLKSLGIKTCHGKLGDNEFKVYVALKEAGIKLTNLQKSDKVLAAQDLIREWNEGRVLVGPQVSEDFLYQIKHFNGNPRNKDDAVDAAVSALENCTMQTFVAQRNPRKLTSSSE